MIVRPDVEDELFVVGQAAASRASSQLLAAAVGDDSVAAAEQHETRRKGTFARSAKANGGTAQEGDGRTIGTQSRRPY
jgi:hypothetical protein